MEDTSAAGGPAVRVTDLRFKYPGQSQPAIDGLSFQVGSGEVFGFLGPSGSGKTTTQRVLLGLVEGWEGEVEILGRPRRAWGTELYDRVGVSFELPVGYPRLTGREDLSHFANLHRVPCRDIGELLDTLGLAEAADRVLAGYSKGMRLRLNLARALLHQPEVLFLDEPTSGLDPVNAAAVHRLIREQSGRGRTVLLTTHDMVTAGEVCDRVAFLVDGRIVACDTPRALRLRHGSRRVRIEYLRDGQVQTKELPLQGSAATIAGLLESGQVETIHTGEATLAEVFATVTGRSL